MIILTFIHGNRSKLGVKTNSGILDVDAARHRLGYEKVLNPEMFFSEGDLLLPELREIVQRATEHADVQMWTLKEEDLEIAPPVPSPEKILCVGLNYRRHAVESNLAIPTTPVLFSKFNNAIAAHNEPIPIVDGMDALDYEAELAAVIGTPCKHVTEDEALNYVLGYCNSNDVSDRALQDASSQWLLGKTPDKFLPIGPYLLTRDEIPDPQDLRIRCWLNGELRQDSNTSDMIFTLAQVISYASQFFTLKPGDIITTGTPEGVILGMDPKVYMKDGDEMVVEIGDGQFGKLTNKVVAS